MNKNMDTTSKENTGKERIYDLAVVGAGPAGSMAAALAVKAGFSTVIIEQKKMPRSKICGGFVSARTLSLLPDDLILPPESFKPVYKITVTKGNNSYSYNAKNRLGLIIKRDQFDHSLAAYARDKGAVLIDKFSLDKLHKEEEDNKQGLSYYLLQEKYPAKSILRARYIIGADGALGPCRLLAGLRKTINTKTGWGLARIIEPDSGSANPGTLNFYPLPFLGGMGWSFNGPGWVNRGVGGLADRRLLIRKYRRLFPEDENISDPSTWPLPFLGPLQKVAIENLLLVGDAAGVIDPFSGEGLFNSLKSSILAVRALIRAEEDNKEAAMIYQVSYNKHLRKGFAPSIAGAAVMHTRSIIAPASLPPLIAAIMENKLWFNLNLTNQPYE